MAEPDIFPPSLATSLNEIVSQYEKKSAALLPSLHRVQEEYGFISEVHEKGVADFLEIPIARVREVISFYGMFHQEPLGSHHIKVCQTLTCYALGQPELLRHLKEKLGIEVGQTTKNKRFTLSTVECLGACEIAPMIQINKDNHGPLTHKKLDELLEGLS